MAGCSELSSKPPIREATEEDLPRLAEIKAGNWADTYSSLIAQAVLEPFLDRDAQLADLRKSSRRPDTLLLVAEDANGIIAGFALTYLDEEPDPWLESLHVSPEHRGAGVGTLLMRETAARIQARGYHSMGLGVVAGNTAAARFYERLGGTMIGREPAAWAEGVWHELYRWTDLATLT